MLRYAIMLVKGSDFPMQKTLHIEGRVDLSQRPELHSTLRETLLGCHHLIVSFQNVNKFDGWLITLLCSAHRTAALLNKWVTIQGMEPGTFEKGNCPKSENCLLENCFLTCIGQTAHPRRKSPIALKAKQL